MNPLEYKLVHKAIIELHTKGLVHLCSYMGDNVIPGRGEGVPGPLEPQHVTLPRLNLTMEPYIQQVMQIEAPLIDLTGGIPLIVGIGRLPNVQVGPRIQERKEKRMDAIKE